MHYASVTDIKIAKSKKQDDDIMRQKTRRLLEKQIGRMTLHDWNVAEQVFYWWIQQQHTTEGVQKAWELLERFVQEQRSSTGCSNRVTTDWLFSFADVWRQQTLRNGSTKGGMPTPEQLFEKVISYQPCVLPDGRIYSILVDTFTKSTKQPKEDAPWFAHRVLNRMYQECPTNPSVVPDAVIYLNVIGAWAKSGLPEAPHKAWEVMEEMLERKACNRSDHESFARALSGILHAWAESDRPDAPDRAHDILSQVVGQQHIAVDAPCYGAVISAYAKDGRAREAEALFRDLEGSYRTTKNRRFKPSTIEYNALVFAWANHGDAERSEAILREMQQSSMVGDDVEPDTLTFNTVISAWASSRMPSAAAQKAESLLQEMQQLHAEGSATVEPDIASFSSVIDAWSKSNEVYAPQRAEGILRRMQKSYEAGTSTVKPNVFAFASVMNAWSKSRAPKAAHRAESLLRWMWTLYEAGHAELKPNTVAYSSVIAAWSNSRSPKAAERARALLLEMQERQMAGDGDMKPNAVTFTSVINAYAKSRIDGAAESAEALLSEMQQLYDNGDNDVKPNTISFNAVISGWAKSQDVEAWKHALNHLEHMKELQAAGDSDCKPSIVTYNTVISALGNARNADAVVKAYELLEEAHKSAENGDPDVKANARTYSALLKAIAMSSLSNKAERALELLKRMEARSVQPSIFVLDEVLHCCSHVPPNDDDEMRAMAFQVAKDILEQVHSSKDMKARPMTYVWYFQACRNARNDNEQRAAIQMGYRNCCQDGLENNRQIMLALAEFPSAVT